MPRYRATNPPTEKPGGEGWLYSAQQQRLCHFKPAMATVHAQWVEVRTFSWVPPRTPKDRAAVTQQTHHPANSEPKRRAAPSTQALRTTTSKT